MRAVRHPAHRHAAKFYETDDSLFETVARFVGDALVRDEPALLIATPAHGHAIEQRLTDHNVEVRRARRMGDLMLLDAEDTLGAFMVDGHPDADLFDTHVGNILGQMVRGRNGGVVRAYGEMVDVLWKQGATEAAIELEILWNKLALTHAFALLCAYSMGNFFKQAEQFHEVCRQHTHVYDPASNLISFERRPQRSV